MLLQILTRTPIWVFALFALLLALGYSQTRHRTVSLKRLTIIPLAMTGLSFYGVVSAFHGNGPSLMAWGITSLIALIVLVQTPPAQGTTYNAATQQFSMPGSWVPMALFMGMFFTKYAVGVILGMQPALASRNSFALPVSALYGAFSGVFLARSARLWRIALKPPTAASLSSALQA